MYDTNCHPAETWLTICMASDQENRYNIEMKTFYNIRAHIFQMGKRKAVSHLPNVPATLRQKGERYVKKGIIMIWNGKRWNCLWAQQTTIGYGHGHVRMLDELNCSLQEYSILKKQTLNYIHRLCIQSKYMVYVFVKEL